MALNLLKNCQAFRTTRFYTKCFHNLTYKLHVIRRCDTLVVAQELA